MSKTLPSRRLLFRTAVALVLPALLTTLLAGCDATGPEDYVPTVEVAGTVTNTHGRPVAGTTVTFDARDEGATAYATATTDAEGRFRADIPPGSYTFVTAADGYRSAGRTLTIEAGGEDDLTQVISGAGTIMIQFISALTGQGSSGIALQCIRRQADGTYPDPAVTYEVLGLSDAAGKLQIAGAPSGPLRCRAEGASFGARLFDVIVRSDGPTQLPPLSISPPAPEGALRIVLTWGQSPSDLDAHLTGPDGTGNRFHIYWGNRSFGSTILDVDALQSYGPETITVFPQVAGMYRYSVFNYSEQVGPGAQGIAQSPTRVEIHDHIGLLCTYEAPPTVQAGNTWRVFEVEAREAGGAIAFDVPCTRGAMGLRGLGYVYAAGSTDLGAFLTSPPPKGSGH